MLILYCCATPNIENNMNSKDLILNTTAQNDTIKVRMRRFAEQKHSWALELTLKNERVLPLWCSFIAFSTIAIGIQN